MFIWVRYGSYLQITQSPEGKWAITIYSKKYDRREQHEWSSEKYLTFLWLVRYRGEGGREKERKREREKEKVRVKERENELVNMCAGVEGVVIRETDDVWTDFQRMTMLKTFEEAERYFLWMELQVQKYRGIRKYSSVVPMVDICYYFLNY